MGYSVKCPLCGELVVGATQDDLVTAADAHGDAKHGGMKAPRAMVLGAARESE